MTTFNPFNELDGTKTIGGVWSVSDSVLPIPATYDANVVLVNIPDGTYTYTYTVTCGSVTVTNDLTLTIGASKIRRNDVCTGVQGIGSLGNDTVLTQSDNALSQCPVGEATLDESTTLSDPYTGVADLWYNFVLKPNTTHNIIEVTITPLLPDPVGTPHLVLYENQEFLVCNSSSNFINNPRAHGQGGPIYYEFPASTDLRYFVLRVGMQTRGAYTINVTLVPAIP